MIFDLIMAAAGVRAAPYVVGASFGGVGNGSTFAVALPSGVQPGDILIAVCQSNSSLTWSGDTGWTELVDMGSLPSLRIAIKTAGPSEPSSYTFGTSLSKTSNAHIVAVRGGTFDAIGIVETAQDPLPARSISVAKKDSLLLACFSSASSSVTPTTPSGMGLVAVDSNSIAPSSAVFSEVVQAGASGSRSSSMGSTTGVAGVLLSISPA